MNWTPDADALRGRVAVVAGATRGAGRGIAAGLGEAGATVICTGRSSVAGNSQSNYDRPETIEETAELVTALGGVGIPIHVDHLDIAQVQALADHIRDEHGALDILVNDIWGAEVLKGPRRRGTGRYGNTTSTTASGYSGSASAPTSSPPTVCCRCLSRGRAACTSK